MKPNNEGWIERKRINKKRLKKQVVIKKNKN